MCVSNTRQRSKTEKDIYSFQDFKILWFASMIHLINIWRNIQLCFHVWVLWAFFSDNLLSYLHQTRVKCSIKFKMGKSCQRAADIFYWMLFGAFTLFGGRGVLHLSSGVFMLCSQQFPKRVCFAEWMCSYVGTLYWIMCLLLHKLTLSAYLTHSLYSYL